MKANKNYLYAAAFLIIIIAAIALNYKKFSKPAENTVEEMPQKIDWKVDENGYLSYAGDREPVLFNRATYNETENLIIHKIIYQSKGANIYGLLVLPKSATELMPGIILMPGAGVSKESEIGLAMEISELGAAVLVIDQRGTGETGGYFATLDEDYNFFINNVEPSQHLLAYDALRAFDLLNNAPFVDSGRIAIAGESLGGRIAVIAAALENDIAGALLISTSGLNFTPKGDKSKDLFIQSIDSDHYIDLITPRKIVMIHNSNDRIIPLSSAVNTFEKAEEPKRFVLVNDTACNHGYCDSMYDGLVEGLDFLVDIRSRTLVSVPG